MDVPELLCVHPDHVPRVWPAVRDMLNAAVLKTDLGHTADIERDVCGGNGVLWIAVSNGAIEAAAVAVLTKTDVHTVCCITAVGGRAMGRWLHFMAAIEKWAKAEGAAKVRIFGRKGWTVMLEDYTVSAVVLEKAL